MFIRYLYLISKKFCFKKIVKNTENDKINQNKYKFL